MKGILMSWWKLSGIQHKRKGSKLQLEKQNKAFSLNPSFIIFVSEWKKKSIKCLAF